MWRVSRAWVGLGGERRTLYWYTWAGSSQVDRWKDGRFDDHDGNLMYLSHG